MRFHRGKKIFISHTHIDCEAVNHFYNALDGEKNTIFYSSAEDKGIKGGQGVSETLDKEMLNCDIFIPVITQNYVRSLFCMYELANACFIKSQINPKLDIKPLCTTKQVYELVSKILDRYELKYIEKRTQRETKYTFEEILKKWNSSVQEEIREFWKQLPNCDKHPGPYIADNEDYQNILSYCYNNGIKKLTSNFCDEGVLKGNIEKADQITIVSTTGDSLIKTLKESIVKALCHGCDVRVVLPNQYSPFISDVAASENVNTPDDRQAHIIRLAQEFNNIFGYLKEAYCSAKEIIGKKDKLGKVAMYCANNCFRQTITLTKKNSNYWAWVTFTMPPARAIDGTPSMMISGPKVHITEENENIKGESPTVINAIAKHCDTIIQLAKKQNAYYEIKDDSEFKPFFLETETAKQYWADKIEVAKDNMSRQLENSEAVLIEVAAQHPLNHQVEPNSEFKARLDEAVSLYRKYKKDKINVKICVPGSRHKFNGVADKISLSKAGTDYLISRKIPKKDVIGEEVLNTYMKDGIYNSADECFAASKLFFEKDFTKLVCVCSPYQAQRKTLFYIEFGIVPMCYCVSAQYMYHSVLKELFVNLPNVVYIDHTWQDKSSDPYRNSRKERKPKKHK